jgi:hypothetical protein
MSDDWQGFMSKLDEFYPKVGDTLQLPLRGGVARLPAPDSPTPDGDKPIRRRV